MRPDYVDFHTHLDLYPDLAQAIAACDRKRVATLAVTTTPKAFERNVELAASSEFVRVGLGLHPQLVAERHSEIKLFEELLPRTRYVGEVGLDAGPRYYKSFDLQKEVFQTILEMCASEGGKILSLHSVRSAKLVLDYLEQYFPEERGTAILHWFTGSVSLARRAVDLGCYFSVNEQMLSSPTGKKLIQEIPFERILTETDGPFVERNGVSIPPADVSGAVRLLAVLTGKDEPEVRRRILANLKSLLETRM